MFVPSVPLQLAKPRRHQRHRHPHRLLRRRNPHRRRADRACPEAAEAPTAAVKTLNFEEVRFEFDQDNLRPDAIAVLDRVVDGFKQNPGIRLRIEGHASAEGTAEYNLALGERRAHRVEEYLVNRGIPASALATLSKGEESPKYDNTKEEGRVLNRRAEFIIDSVSK